MRMRDGDAWGPIFETDVVFRVVISADRPDVAKSRDPYSLWTACVVPVPALFNLWPCAIHAPSVCGHAPSVAHAADVVIQVVRK